MKGHYTMRMNRIIAVTTASVIGTFVIAAAPAQFSLESDTQDAGGETLSGLTYTLSGTVAQPEAGPALSGTTYTLTGGFWARPASGSTNNCVADFDNDGDVDLGDFGVFGATFGAMGGDASYNQDADFDNDGDVDLGDFGVFGSQFGRTDCF